MTSTEIFWGHLGGKVSLLFFFFNPNNLSLDAVMSECDPRNDSNCLGTELMFQGQQDKKMEKT